MLAEKLNLCNPVVIISHSAEDEPAATEAKEAALIALVSGSTDIRVQ
jgi:hypothetical protein